MNISAKTEYACIAVLELSARYQSDDPIQIRTIADANGIPSRFLVQILLQLKAAGLVQSTRGAAGGYRLERPPKDITLHEVMAVIEGHADNLQLNTDASTPTTNALLSTWNRVHRSQKELLTGITFDDLVNLANSDDKNMYYI